MGERRERLKRVAGGQERPRAARWRLVAAELEAVAASGRAGAATKVSRRDLGWAVQRTRADPAACGATTVAATAWAARRAGVHVFATGGLGGVHRGASDTRDAGWQSTGE